MLLSFENILDVARKGLSSPTCCTAQRLWEHHADVSEAWPQLGVNPGAQEVVHWLLLSPFVTGVYSDIVKKALDKTRAFT